MTLRHRGLLVCTLTLALCGCLVPGDRTVPDIGKPPTPQPATLSRTITDANTAHCTELAKLAATIAAEIRANALSAEQQGDAWNKGSAAITGDMNTAVATSVKAALSAATTPQAQAAVWDEIAKGYRP